MAYQMTFKRYELKYRMNREQKENILRSMEEQKPIILLTEVISG